MILKTRQRKNGATRNLILACFYRYVKIPKLGVCPVKHCTRRSRADRSLCRVHDMRMWRAKHPERSSFVRLKGHAKERGIPFDLTFNQFMDVAKDFPFRTDKPEDFKEYLSIDRIDNNKGYEPGNVQCLTISENAKKGTRFEYSHEGQHFKALAEAAEYQAAFDNQDGVPF